MSAHIPPCDVETNGGDCSCAETWKERCLKAEEHAASFMGQLDPYIYRTRRLEAVICSLLASAVPHPKEHPTMWRAWRDAETVLGIPPEKTATIRTDRKTEAELLPMLSSESKPGDKVFTHLSGFVVLVREMNGESGVNGWEVQDRTERFLYMTYDDFRMTAAEVADVRRLLAERRPANAKEKT